MLADRQDVAVGIFEPRDLRAARRGPDPGGVLIERVLFRPIHNAPVLSNLVAFIALFSILNSSAGQIWDFNIKTFPTPFGTAPLFGERLISTHQAGMIGVTLVMLGLLYLFFRGSRLGLAMRAAATNPESARLVGIRTTLSGQVAFLFASVIGALSGILIVPIATLYYDTGFLIGLKGFIAAIIGGLVSYPLTAAAALVVGIVEAFSSFYASNFKEVIVFTLLIPVLLLRSLAAPAVEEEE